MKNTGRHLFGPHFGPPVDYIPGTPMRVFMTTLAVILNHFNLKEPQSHMDLMVKSLRNHYDSWSQNISVI